MNYNITIKPSAVRESKKIPEPIKKIIRRAMDSLRENPRPPGVKKLKGRSDIYRIKIKDYRVLYTIDDHQKYIDVLSILHRKEAYR